MLLNSGKFWKYAVCLIAVAGGLFGCDRSEPQDDYVSPRVVTFSPALTSMIVALGLEDHLVGVDRYSVLPENLRRPIVGDTLNIRSEPILAVRPDIILSQVDVSCFEPVLRIDPHIRAEYVRIESLADVSAAVELLGRLVGKADVARRQQRDFDAALDRIRRRCANLPRKRVLFVLGYHNPSSVGGGTFVGQLIECAGGVNIMADEFELWKQPSLERIIALKPDVVICQVSAPQAEQAELYWRELLGQAVDVHIVTDDRWTIPGLHLTTFADRLAQMIHGSAYEP
ncbi:MAG: ABC transporter substrate-binding protein [Sedimentisphaerales bacterium]|nr:ABC transporter substrate-binding protein [Sedimentisphaerales bacterium]